MTVQELSAILSQYPPETEIALQDLNSLFWDFIPKNIFFDQGLGQVVISTEGINKV